MKSFFLSSFTVLVFLAILITPALPAPATTTTKKAVAATTTTQAITTTSAIPGTVLGSNSIIDTANTPLSGETDTTISSFSDPLQSVTDTTTATPGAIGTTTTTASTTNVATLVPGQMINQPTTTASPANAGSSVNAISCNNQPDGTTFPFPNDCTHFYRCEFFVMFLIGCPTGMAYNSLIKGCDTMANAHGC